MIRALLLLLLCAPAFAQPIPGFLTGGDKVIGGDYNRGSVGWHAYWFIQKTDGTIASYYVTCPHSAANCPAGPNIAAAVQNCKRSATPVACAQAYYTQQVTFHCSDFAATDTSEIGRLCVEMNSLRTAYAAANGIAWPAAAASTPSPAASAPEPPASAPSAPTPPASAPDPVVTYRVAPLTGATDRPGRQVVNGALVTPSKPLRAAIGSPCDAERILPTFPSGSNLWAAVVGQPVDWRWLCAKQP